MNTMTRPFSAESNRSNIPLLTILGISLFAALALLASMSSLRVSSGNGYSVPALYNQANADAAQGRTGLAIANYERARLLAPNNADINANLQWVREHASLPIASQSWLDRTVSWASPNTLAVLGALGLVLVGAGILSARFLSRLHVGFYLAAFAGILLLDLSILSAVNTWQKCRQAVVVASEAPARISPVTNGETSFKLRSGELVAVDGHYKDFALVKDSAGHSGWVAQSDITPLIPTQSN